MINKIVALGMYSLARKHIDEFRQIISLGYKIEVFSNNSFGESEETSMAIGDDLKHFYLEKSFILRFKQINNYLKENKNSIKLAHIYPAGRFGIVYLILCKIYNIKTVCVEWGNLSDWDAFPIASKISMIACYKYCDAVWYKEPYMKPILENYGAKNLYFIHNAYNTDKIQKHDNVKSIDFLWVNRIIPQRKANWFVDSLHNKVFENTNNVLSGFVKEVVEDGKVTHNIDPRIVTLQNYLEINKPDNLSIYEFSDPFEFYKKSKFFVLPTVIVFGNNALIEAMAHGVVPIVTKSTGVEEIVEDGVNGFIVDFNQESFLLCMTKAMKLPESEYILMSENAKEMIMKKFNRALWLKKIAIMYKDIS